MRSAKRIKYLTVGAMLSALGVVFLSLGSLIEVLDLTSAILASLLCVYAVIELGRGYPWLIWLVTSILSLLLLPVKTPALFYALFAGVYPILKEKAERLGHLPCFLIKAVILHISLGLIFLTLKLFIPSSLESYGLWWLPLILYLLCLACFWLYDIALTRMITFYMFRLRRRFGMRREK